MKKHYLYIITLLFSFSAAFAQDGKVTFNGVSRSIIQNNTITGNLTQNDTTNAKQLFSGYTLLDLGFNIKPNKNTQIISVVRLRNEFGGMYGAGVKFDIRQLTAKGVIGKAFKYQVGDIWMKQSALTFRNNTEETKVNEAEIFKISRQINYYENFYTTDNEWRMQGIQGEFGLNFDEVIKEITVTGFLTRNRPYQYATDGTKIFSGARLRVMQSKYLTVAGNYMSNFDIKDFVSDINLVTNKVANVNIKGTIPLYENNDIILNADLGQSQLNFKNFSGLEASPNKTDGFNEIEGGVNLKKIGLVAKIGFRQVGLNYYNPAAQTKRIRFDAMPTYFGKMGNKGATTNRQISAMDIIRDELIYNQTLSGTLMAYNPLYGNVTQYGTATPNRSGIYVDAELKQKAFSLFAKINSSSELKGDGTENKRSFSQTVFGGNLNIDKLVGLKRKLLVHAGYQGENTTRSGEAYQSIDFKSSLIEAGLEWEFAKDLDFLIGAKLISGKGNEFLAVRDKFNSIQSYKLYSANVEQQLLGFGVRYRFAKNIDLTINSQMFTYSDKANNQKDYGINQVYMLFNLQF